MAGPLCWRKRGIGGIGSLNSWPQRQGGAAVRLSLFKNLDSPGLRALRNVKVKNSADSSMIHSVDFHAATGPGGAAAALQVDPSQEKSMTWKALGPGLYVY